jgi:EAL domain-containing protein (putative c-di-GMP-specific phosphodiesterase class I)
VTALKIDRTFIVEMTESADGLAIVSSMIALAHSLKLKVVAEDVETKEQEEKLRLLGCDEAQGYLFSKPVPYEAIEVLLRGDQILSVSDFAA